MTASDHSHGSPRLVAVGEALIDISPTAPGASLEDDGILQAWPGGAPANVAVAAARLGAAVSFVGAVGDDAFGRRLRTTLAEAAVDVSGVVSVAQPTAVAFVALAADGEREFTFYGRPAAHDMLTLDDVEAYVTARPLNESDFVHLSSNCLVREPARAASHHALVLARRVGAGLSFDLNLRLPLWDRPARSEVIEVVRPSLDNARLLKLSLDELEYLTGRRSLAAAQDLAEDLLSRSTELVTVTLGAGGTWYVTRACSGHVRGFAVEAIDTTGAGDAFMGAVVVASLRDPNTWANKQATEAALREACAYAALSTTRPGGISSYVDRSVLSEFLATNSAGESGRSGGAAW